MAFLIKLIEVDFYFCSRNHSCVYLFYFNIDFESVLHVL